MNQSGEGLRDRKKRRTRAALERATLRLSAERGYDNVTVEEIAAEADVSVRTFFNYFAGKDDALIGADPESGPRMVARIRAEPAEVAPFEAFREAVLAEIDAELNNARDLWLLRKEVLMSRKLLIPPRELGRYSGLFGAVFGVGTVAGPLIGGVLVDTSWLGWRWCFLIGVPFSLAAIWLLQRTLHLPVVRKENVRIDYLGAVLIVSGVSTLLIWSSLAGSKFDWWSGWTALLVTTGVEAAHLRERTRIAHEVHDTLGHELSLLALQAGALELTLPEEHQAAAAQLRVTAGGATERLADLVFLLRDGDPPPVDDVRGLVDRASKAGLRVEFEVDGAVPSTVDRTVRRVVQEALTNAAKHAPKSLLRIRISTADGTTVVEAGNEAGLRRAPGSRLGLIALRERVRLAGGTLRVSRSDGRFELVAVLPHSGES